MSQMICNWEWSGDLASLGNIGQGWRQFITAYGVCSPALLYLKGSTRGRKRICYKFGSWKTSVYLCDMRVAEMTTKELRLSMKNTSQTITPFCENVRLVIVRAEYPCFYWSFQIYLLLLTGHSMNWCWSLKTIRFKYHDDQIRYC